jgi:transcriptional regulator
MKSSIRFDHIFTNAAKSLFKAVSRSIGGSDHNIVAISRKTNVPKAGPNILFKKSYNTLLLMKIIFASLWCVMRSNQTTLDTFMKLLIPVANKHAPIDKMTKKWID